MNAVADKLTNIEWLGQQMRAKTANYEVSEKDTNLEPVTWQDRCGAIASIEDPATQAYCSILVWGDYRDNTESFNILVNHVAGILYEAASKETQRKHFNLKAFCHKVARMGVALSLRPDIKEDRKLQGILKFFGITEIKADTYSKNYAYLETMVDIILKDMIDEIDFYVYEYRKNMRKVIN
ncbi:hypothetical protein LVY74_02125 [Acinetobacter sp. ME22]|uniref:hypothetical protein n=1 Tax=Acinetobacter sp. ME22 TaxID=2904802 RepID=UPI001EDBA8EE|nr:hypothetical protein [Acinetobacter sp. ME22]MCG2572354.1 hypothetical protein [Acinetobacter sp. ME22]